MKVSVDIDLNSLLITAFEGACGYWGDLSFVEGELQIVEHDSLTHYLLQKRHYVEGARAMAAGSPRLFARIIAGNADQDAADVFIQYAAFGEVRYA